LVIQKYLRTVIDFADSEQPKIHSTKNPTYRIIYANSRSFTEWIDEQTNYKNKIPDFILDDRDNTKKLLRGLMDSEGSINKAGEVTFRMKDRDFVETIRCLFNIVGIKTSPKTSEQSLTTKPPGGDRYYKSKQYYFYINTRDYAKIGFNIKRKQDRLEQYLSKPRKIRKEYQHTKEFFEKKIREGYKEAFIINNWFK